MITGIGKYWKWFQITKNTGICVGFYHYKQLNNRWDYELLPRLSVGKLPMGGDAIYNLRLDFWSFSFAIDIETSYET
ncbi:hypothetical protein L6472_06045 [Prevotella sp. E13-17]|uniref:hypothetical protein n=1 Tax=Prevotella sp. E13-17 TaxID=2913616 RepID=UPI001EDBF4A4|nr:hypothetical protein [Prevotella sp. E13-17]UKK52139.1 hypothetical protein L6472_06045 [Prevotella sp. E13-17]